jgi:hypothetical protein
MRIALLFCGRVNGYQDCYESFMNHIIRSFDGVEYDSFLAHNAENRNVDIDTFLKLYNVKQHVNEIPAIDNVQGTPRHPEAEAMGLSGFKMFYYWKRAFELMEDYSKTHSIHYDIVIYMRADEFFQSNMVLPYIEQNKIYVPEGYDHNGLNDQMAVGRIDAMRSYMNVYCEIPTIFQVYRRPFHPETYALIIAHYKKLTVVRFKLAYHLHVNRHK